ncbi:MAG: VIT1/CCC1 transporter family protein [Candidatus Thorarchaeota archaeon]
MFGREMDAVAKGVSSQINRILVNGVMMPEPLIRDLLPLIAEYQKNELTEHIVYRRLASSTKDAANREVLQRLSDEELAHYEFWKELSGLEPRPSWMRVWKILLTIRLFGLTFGLKLMERGEKRASEIYEKISEKVPFARDIARQESEHERELLSLVNEEKLKYVSSMVLGLNDAIVELTGALAGLAFALQVSRLVGMVGLITGIAASLSMGSSEYLSTKSEAADRSPTRASAYTTLAYVLAVTVLILPFLILENVFLSLVASIVGALTLLLVFTFYISVAKDLPFRKRFLEASAISLGVAGLTFLIGLLVRALFGIEV